MSTIRRGLGRGLAELIKPAGDGAGPGGGEQVLELSLSVIDPNPVQPRAAFDPAELAELAASIKAQGLLQPITVRPAAGGRYELVAGERRLRATRDLGRTTIRAIVREVDDRALLGLALVENIQRSQLNEIEVAKALRMLQDEHALTAQQVGELVGRSRSAVANTVRLLELPAEAQALIEGGALSAGHGRAILAFPEPLRLQAARDAAAQDLSVRALEQLAAHVAAPRPRKPKAALKPSEPAPTADPALKQAQRRLEEHFGTRVKVEQAAGRGTISLAWHGPDDLDRLLDLLLGGASPL